MADDFEGTAAATAAAMRGADDGAIRLAVTAMSGACPGWLHASWAEAASRLMPREVSVCRSPFQLWAWAAKCKAGIVRVSVRKAVASLLVMMFTA